MSAFVVLLLVAGLATLLVFKVPALPVAHVDRRLVQGAQRSLPTDQTAHGARQRGRFGGRIFISYRRQDASAWARLLRDALAEHCYPARIFRDIEQIRAGDDFAEVIDGFLAKADVVIVLIGPSWLGATDREGRRPRLDHPSEWVRVEIAHALGREDLLVIPAPVGGASIPSADELPEALVGLAGRQAIELSDERWEYDVRRLVDEMRSAAR